MTRTVTGIDMGLRAAKILRGSYKSNTFHATDFAVVDLHSQDIADGWPHVRVNFKLDNARVGLTGKDVNLRYTRVPRVPDWQLRKLMRFEVEEIGGQSGSGVASDFNVLPELPEVEGEDVVVLAMARANLLARHAEGLKSIGARLDAFSPNAIALYNAYLRFGVVHDDTVLVANIGYENVDVVIARGPDLLFARNLTGGARLFEDAIAQRFGVDARQAAELQRRGTTLEPGARFTDPNHEKASRACLAAAGQILSLLQSAVLFCKSQVRISGLKLDRVLLCGGGAAQAGLPKYLAAGLGVPVELFDAFRMVDTSRLSAESAAALERAKLSSVVALGLATMASDPDAYSVEILPDDVKRRRELWGARVYWMAAAALAALYLGYDAYRTASELGTLKKRGEVLTREYKRASQTHVETQETLAENARYAALASRLHALKGSGEQVARTVDALERELPADFWITNFTSGYRADPELGIPRDAERPVVSITGRAREGTTTLSSLYEGFIHRLRARLPERVALKERLTPTGAKFTLDLSFFAPPAPDAVAAAESSAPESSASSTPATTPSTTPAAAPSKPPAPRDARPNDRAGKKH